MDRVCRAFATLFTFKVLFLSSRQSLDIWDNLITLSMPLYHNKRCGHIFVLPWNKFPLKPIRFSICDCQHCLVITWAKWVLLNRLINRHYCSLMSSSPCLSVRCVYYDCYLSFPLNSASFPGLGCKGRLCFPLSSAIMLCTITSHSTYYDVSSMTVLEKVK